MNISTYEARIAALEAQLGPVPGPSDEIGLDHVYFTPNPWTDNDKQISDAITEVFPHLTLFDPAEKEADTLNIQLASQADTKHTYHIELTPTSEAYASIVDWDGHEYHGESLGETCTADITIDASDSNSNYFTFYATPNLGTPHEVVGIVITLIAATGGNNND